MKSQSPAVFSLIVATALAFSLAGCAGTTAAVPAATRTAVTTAEPAKSPAAPTTAPSPTADPTDPASWVISFDGFGPLAFGGAYSVSDPRLAAFQPDASANCPNPRMRFLEPKPGPSAADRPSFTVELSEDQKSIGSHMSIGLMNIISQHAQYPSTSSGIRVGSTEAETKAAYPKGVVRAIHEDGSYPYLSVPNGSGRFMLFYFGQTGGPVTGIAVQTTPDNVYEVCS